MLYGSTWPMPMRSVPHRLIEFVQDFFHISKRSMINKYFGVFKLCCTKQDFTTEWQQDVEVTYPRSLLLTKGNRNDNAVFFPGGEEIPRLISQPICCLGREYTAKLLHKQVETLMQKQLIAKNDHCMLAGKYKVWCCQSILI